MEDGERGLDYSGTMRSTTAARAWLCLAASARACTDFYMNFTDHKLSVRTMDLGTTANASLVITPRGRAFASRAPAAAAGGDATVGAVLEWTSAYGHVSFNFADHVLSAAPSAWERALADALVAGRPQRGGALVLDARADRRAVRGLARRGGRAAAAERDRPAEVGRRAVRARRRAQGRARVRARVVRDGRRALRVPRRDRRERRARVGRRRRARVRRPQRRRRAGWGVM